MIGSTETKEPDGLSDEDIEFLTPEQLRGEMKVIAKAKQSMGQLATIQGCATEIEVLKQQLEMTHEQMRRLIGMYQTLQVQFEQMQNQRLKELNVRVNGGSTTPEDIDASDVRSRN